MSSGLGALIFPVNDVVQAKALYSKLLGQAPFVDEPYYVGFKIGDLDVGLDPHGHRGGTVGYWVVDDIHATLAELLTAGAQTEQAVKDVGGGMLTATLKDADGNVIGLRQSP